MGVAAFSVVLLVQASWATVGTGNCKESYCYWLHPGMTPKDAPEHKFQPHHDHLYIHCYEGINLFSREAFSKLWSSVHAQIHSNSSTEMELIHGNSSAQVLEKYRKKNRWFVWPWHEDSANLSPFGEPCFGVVFAASDVEYYVHTTIRAVQWQFPVCLFLGFLLFFSAGKLSRTHAFFYSSGAALGVLALLLVIVFVLSRRMRGRTAEYAVLIGGSGLYTYFLKWMLENFQEVMSENKEYVAYYIISGAVLGFTVCYFYGPPEERRRQNLVKWSIQVMSACLLYWSTQVREASVIVIIIVGFLYWKRRQLFGRIARF